MPSLDGRALNSVADYVPRWSREVAHLRAQARKIRRGATPKESEVVAAALEACESLLRDLAGAQQECERLAATVRAEVALWERLFEVMPRACVLTDSGGFIVNANAAAGALLNVSARHLKDRQLLVFTRDRDAFRVLVERLSRGESELRGSLWIRPRERRLVQIDFQVVGLTPDSSGMWLWFLSPAGAADTESAPDAPGGDVAAPAHTL